jgi:hypothetical protein
MSGRQCIGAYLMDITLKTDLFRNYLPLLTLSNPGIIK